MDLGQHYSPQVQLKYSLLWVFFHCIWSPFIDMLELLLKISGAFHAGYSAQVDVRGWVLPLVLDKYFAG